MMLVAIDNNPHAVIPAIVRYDKDLSADEKLLYGELATLSNNSGYCLKKDHDLSKLYNVDEETINQWIDHLNQKGFIHVVHFSKDSNDQVHRLIYLNYF